MNYNKVKEYLENQDSLPERGYCLLPSDKEQVIIVVKGEKGYYDYQKYPNAQMAKETVDYCNNLFDVTEEQAEALMILSMRN